MKLTDITPDDAIIREIGLRVRANRIASDLTQQQLAQRAGVSPRTIANVEGGQGGSLQNLIRIMRALGLASRFEVLVPEQDTHPLDLAKGKPVRKRVRHPRVGGSRLGWKWGDEQ